MAMFQKIKKRFDKIGLFIRANNEIFQFLSSVIIVLAVCFSLVFDGTATPLSGLETTIVLALSLIMFVIIFMSAFSVFYGIEDRPFYIFYFFSGLFGLAMLLISSFAWFYRVYGIYDSDGKVIRDSASALYFSLVTWTTLGYGDFRPTEEVRLLAATEALLGYVYMAMLIGIFIWLLTTTSKIGKNQRDKSKDVDSSE